MRDTYDAGDHLVIVTTDRQSAFDRLLASVPFKGQARAPRRRHSPAATAASSGACCLALPQVLNQTSAWWFERTAEMVPNALLAVPHPNVSVMRKCSVFPVEFVGERASPRPPARSEGVGGIEGYKGWG